MNYKINKLKLLKLKIGFVGQGFVGKNHADDFERRGYKVVRYSLESDYINNGHLIKDCDVVFIATPTPTSLDNFDYTSVKQAVRKVGPGKIAVIKSTIIPGTTEIIQKENPDKIIIHAPEFLSEATAARDAAFPDRNIIGIPKDTLKYRKAARLLLNILPNAPYNKVCRAKEAELIKYGRNTMGVVRIVFANILYDTALAIDADWGVIQEAMSADPDNGPTYMNPIHKSGRGAGGHCFIKDFAALRHFFEKNLRDKKSLDVLNSIENKNIELLKNTSKDLDLLTGVYGEEVLDDYHQEEPLNQNVLRIPTISMQ